MTDLDQTATAMVNEIEQALQQPGGWQDACDLIGRELQKAYDEGREVGYDEAMTEYELWSN
jgi:hypothetical protein